FIFLDNGMAATLIYTLSYTTLFRSKASLPTMRISLIFARSPSKTSKLTPTRLRGNGVMMELISTPYFPLDKYCCFNSNSARSSRSEEHTSELQSRENLVCRLLLEKK